MAENSVMGFLLWREAPMTSTTNLRKILGIARAAKHPVRFTALLYLKQALLDERYEDCAEIIAIAQEFGAETREIRFLLEDPRRQPRV